tara:strand:+ start:585 stop:824 length:240 start_codon:yes stop_codon:yes gene_type:complete
MPTAQGVNVEVSSYTRGGTFESGSFVKLADVLREYAVDQGEAIIEVTGEDGEERKVTAAMNLQEGDTIVIMKAKNKSGR